MTQQERDQSAFKPTLVGQYSLCANVCILYANLISVMLIELINDEGQAQNYGPERRNDNVDDFPLEETIGVDDHFENSNFEIDERPHPMDEVTDNVFPPLSPCQAKKSSNHYQSEVFFTKGVLF